MVIGTPPLAADESSLGFFFLMLDVIAPPTASEETLNELKASLSVIISDRTRSLTKCLT